MKYVARSANLNARAVRRAPTVEEAEAGLGRRLTPVEARPVARVGDKTACPAHGTGVITGPGADVIIGGKPVARLTDKCLCLIVTQPPPNPDMITSGSSNVFIGGLPVARVGDSTLHGAVIIEGSADVLIGGGTSEMQAPPQPESESGSLLSDLWDGGWGLLDAGMIVVDVMTFPSGEAAAGIAARRSARAIQRAARPAGPNAKVWPRVGRIHINPEKVGKQMRTHGWTEADMAATIEKPHRTFRTTDHRNLPGGGRVPNDPATGYVNRDGSYVIRNDRTGDIVQISNRNKPGFRGPRGK